MVMLHEIPGLRVIHFEIACCYVFDVCVAEIDTAVRFNGQGRLPSPLSVLYSLGNSPEERVGLQRLRW